VGVKFPRVFFFFKMKYVLRKYINSAVYCGEEMTTVGTFLKFSYKLSEGLKFYNKAHAEKVSTEIYHKHKISLYVAEI